MLSVGEQCHSQGMLCKLTGVVVYLLQNFQVLLSRVGGVSF